MHNPLYIEHFREIFETAQKEKIFEDQKIMTDVVPRISIEKINETFNREKNRISFDLRQFIKENFFIREITDESNSSTHLPLLEHIEHMWSKLEHQAFQAKGTLIKLPKPYIVPGGRFEEFFYWDSYFIMLGLQHSGRVDMMRNIVDNAAYLIKQYGLYPTANRTYFLSRSQPPFFALMLDLLAKTTKDDSLYSRFFDVLEKEYEFWMEGIDQLDRLGAYRRIVKLQDGEILNRYYDDKNEPRPESFSHDVEDAKQVNNDSFYRHIRAACESGWDFSSRWFADGQNISTIHTLDLLTPDLNSLLLFTEKLLSKTAKSQGKKKKASLYAEKAFKRAKAIDKYFWDDKTGLYRDYNHKKSQQTRSEHLGTVYPLFIGISSQVQSNKIAQILSRKFLKAGGLITSTKTTGQQWDAPNAWAPLQWMAFQGLRRYEHHELAKKIAERWCANVERVYQNTGRLMEKYDAKNTKSLASGGEYTNQIGFGWTNGVYTNIKKLV